MACGMVYYQPEKTSEPSSSGRAGEWCRFDYPLSYRSWFETKVKGKCRMSDFAGCVIHRNLVMTGCVGCWVAVTSDKEDAPKNEPVLAA